MWRYCCPRCPNPPFKDNASRDAQAFTLPKPTLLNLHLAQTTPLIFMSSHHHLQPCGTPRTLWCTRTLHVQRAECPKKGGEKKKIFSTKQVIMWEILWVVSSSEDTEDVLPTLHPLMCWGLMNINVVSPCFELSPALITQTAIKHMHIVVLIKEIKSCVVGYFNKVVWSKKKILCRQPDFVLV